MKELKGTDKFPDQWGIFWIAGAWKSSHYFWNDKSDIIIIKETGV